MTENEFRQRWFPHHTAQFTGIIAWLGKFPAATSKTGLPGQEDVLRAWYRQLASLDIDLAIAASDELANSAEDFQPRSFDRHPAAVVAIAKRLGRDRAPQHEGPRYVDGHEVFRCSTCLDTGAVTVWHPQTIAAVKAGKFEWRYAYECAVPCTCESTRGLGWMKCKPYDANTMLATKPWLPKVEQLAELTAFVAGLDERRLAAKQHREFDEFSGVSGRDRAAGGF